jgi:hypothetical protein
MKYKFQIKDCVDLLLDYKIIVILELLLIFYFYTL